ncbi:MAG: TRAM domain-containing protein [Planctomycetales bacterium]|nr:TRAM domain-containing protein [bacterium]UNM08486.1 MAG: TRAM domain-containing protein [Planctomycetales bacterium]
MEQDQQPRENGGEQQAAPSAVQAHSKGQGNGRHNGQKDDPRVRLLLAKLLATLTGMIIGMAITAVVSSNLLPEQQEKVSSAQEEINEANKSIAQMNPEWQKAYDERTAAKESYDDQVDADLLELFTKGFNNLRSSTGSSTKEMLDSLESDPDRLILELYGILTEDQAKPAEDRTIDDAVRSKFLSKFHFAGGSPAAADDQAEAQASAVPATSLEFDPDLNTSALLFLELRRKDYEYIQVDNEYSKFQLSVTLNQEVISVTERFIGQIDLISLAIIFICTILGYLTHPIAERLIKRIAQNWREFDFGPGQRSTPAAIGFFAGMLLAIVVLLLLFTVIPLEQSIMDQSWFKVLVGTVIVLIISGIGAITGATYFGPREDPDLVDEYIEFRRNAAPKLLDTSVIIDGRIYEIAQTRFLDGYLVVTGSVLRELQTLADSADERKRIKGRSGLELVQKMQDDNRVDLRIFDDSQFDSQANGVDDQLMIVCREMGAQVVTNDYNLNRVAAILNVKVLNINALANSVKTRHLPGDEIVIKITDRGKQKGQGVGYLEDGTMVVIEDGGGFIGQNKLVRITSVSQTAQGRLLFARVDLANGEGDG